MAPLHVLVAAIVLGAGLAAPLAAQQPGQNTKGAPLTSASTIGELLDNPAAHAVLSQQVPLLADNPQIAAARNLALRAIARYAPTVLTDDKLRAIDAALAHTPGAVSSGKVTTVTASLDPRVSLTLKTIPLWEGGAPGALGDRPEDTPTLTVVSTDGQPPSARR